MAIDPIQFQGFTERQGFDPIKVPDPNPFLRENLSIIDASLENLKKGNLANMQAKADAYSKQLAQLSDFSETLSGFLNEAGTIYDKKQQAAANALFYEDLAKQDEEVAAFERGEQILQEGDNISSRAAVAANRNGAPYSISKRIAELGGLKGHYYRIKATQEIASKWGDFYDEARRTDERELTYGDGQKVKINKAEPTEVEEAVIRAALREEYMEEFDGISRGMIAKYAFPAMRQVDESRASANADRIAISSSERERAEALDMLLQNAATNPGALQTYLDTVSRTVKMDRNGKVVSLQYGGSWEQFQTDVLAMVNAGKYVDVIGLVGDSVNPTTGKKYMDDPVFSTKLLAIQAEVKKAETQRYRDTQTNGQVQFQQTLDKVISELPEVPTDSHYIYAYQELEKVARALGVEPDFSKLDDHKQRFSKTALQTKDAIARYEQYQKSGQLGDYVGELLREPREIQERFLETAKNQQKLQESERGYKSVDSELEALITNNDRIVAVPGKSGKVGKQSAFVLDHVTALHRKRTNELIATEEYNDRPEEAAQIAFQEIQKTVLEGRDNKSSIYYIGVDGYENFLPERLGANPGLAANRRLQTINRIAQDEGKSVLENEKSLSSILDKDTLVKAAEGWGRPGYRMDPAIRHLAKRLGLSPLNVIHRARATFGMTELPALQQLTARAENASPDFRSAIDRITSGSISQNQLRRVSSTRDLPVRSTFQAAQPAQVIEPIDSPNHPFFVSIGVNEGTRTANGGYTKNWEGHTDPGDGHNNRGTVSGGRGNNKTPQQVDDNWMRLLAQTQTKYSNQVSRFATPGTDMYNTIMFNILDLRVQAPAAVPDFVKRIPQILAEGATPQVIGRLRAEAFINPRTGRLEASGFNNDMNRLQADQTRRAGNFRIAGGS
jgi:DNA-binding transcriptional regulator YdaS (Cro superfamily)